MVAAFRARCAKPALAAWPLIIDGARDCFRAESMHVFPEYARGVRAMSHLCDYAEALRSPRSEAAPAEFDWRAQTPDPRPGDVISEHRCHAILALAGLPVAAGRLAISEDMAVAAAGEVGFPVAMKGISEKVMHRAAARLLALSVKSEEEVRERWRRLQARAEALAIPLEGVYVQNMANEGVELLVSAFRDPDFGLMLSLGAGGAMTELTDDAIVVPVPLSEAAATEALNRLLIVRRQGGLPAGPSALTDFVVRFAAVAAAAPWRRFVLEVNLIKWTPALVTAVDALLIIEVP
jgi:acetate---CoA ligase (ADP-forming)